MTIAQTILAQLGGNRFIAMTGAKNLLDCGNGLSFKLPARFAANGINYVRVTLSPADLYEVYFYKYNTRTFVAHPVAHHTGIYADMLRNLFTAETGLETSL